MRVEKLIGQLYQYISSGGYLMKEPSHLAKYDHHRKQRKHHCHALMGFQNQILLCTCSILSHKLYQLPLSILSLYVYAQKSKWSCRIKVFILYTFDAQVHLWVQHHSVWRGLHDRPHPVQWEGKTEKVKLRRWNWKGKIEKR